MQLAMHMVTIEDLMPQGALPPKAGGGAGSVVRVRGNSPALQQNTAVPAIDPVVIVKYLLVGFLYGIPSERQIERRVQTDIALRWYLGLDLFDRVPDHSTISQLRRRKPSFRRVFRQLFEEVVRQCIEKGLVSGRVVGTDSTHVRANASRASEELAEITDLRSQAFQRQREGACGAARRPHHPVWGAARPGGPRRDPRAGRLLAAAVCEQRSRGEFLQPDGHECFAVLASDGLWDVMDHADVASLLQEFVREVGVGKWWDVRAGDGGVCADAGGGGGAAAVDRTIDWGGLRGRSR